MSWNSLPEFVKLLICAGVGAAVMICALIVLCQCLWLWKKHWRKKKGFQSAETSEPDENELADIAPHSHMPKERAPGDKKWASQSIRSKTSLSSSGSEGYGSLKEVRYPRKQELKRSASQSSFPALDEIQFLQVRETIQEPGSLGSIEFSLSYDKMEGKLAVKVITARELKLRAFGGMPNPYVRVSLHKDGTEPPDFEFQTSVQPRTLSPTFDQAFEAPIKASTLPKYTLRLVICDRHRLGQSDIIGEVEMKLKGVNWQTEVDKDMALEPSTQVPCGELLVSLSYLPTSERLCIAILRANGFSGVHEPFVRVCLVIPGKTQLPRRRIASIQQLPSLVFDEAIFFEVPREKLERVKILIVVMEETIGADEPDAEVEATPSPVESEIGKILLGRNCSLNAHEHWEEIIQTPRIPFAQWYPIFQDL